jgi:membrane protease YdiL (CAAX protease family)
LTETTERIIFIYIGISNIKIILGGIALNSSDTAKEIRSSQPAHWGFWGTVIWGAVIVVIFVVLQVITILVVVVSRNGNLSKSELRKLLISAGENGNVLSLSTFVTTVMCCGLIVGVIKLKKGSALTEYLCVRSVSLKQMLRWIGFLAGFIVLSDLITTLLGRPRVPDFMSAVYATASPVWTIWVALIIAAPLFEETFFRGFLFKGFESSFMGPIGAVVVTAGLWAVIHLQYDAYEVTTIFCLGILLGVARVFTGSLLVPLGLHAAVNLVATIEAAISG